MPALLTSPCYRSQLANGIVLLVYENPSANIVAGRLFLRQGSSSEPPEQAGLLALLSALLTKGSRDRSAHEIAEFVESSGASLGTDVANDYFLVSLKSVAADFPALLTLAAELLRYPSLPDAEFDLEQRLALEALRSQREQPFNLAYDQLRQSLYGQHPYALDTLGTETTLGSLSRDRLAAAHQQYFRPDQLVISVAGQITPEEAESWVEEVFGDWQNPPTPAPIALLPDRNQPSDRVSQVRQMQQLILMLGFATVDVRSPDYTALKLLAAYLGNGMSSRLFVELREKQSLAYEVSAVFPTRLGPAPFVAYLGTAIENGPQALAALRSELDRLSVALLSSEEVAVTQRKVLGQYALSKQSNAQIAQLYGWYETLGLGIDFDQQFPEAIAAVQATDLQRVAQTWLQQGCLSLVGPEAAIADLI
ncbi:M16 family metallopeptidase [Synechococcus elongatus]|uniref:Processing protease n=1 Tax=Synechococcus elongatus (strain ATCC 33912 / PCC 7942 / FACHB-805) TaxID=1140 RepID=Q31NW3_SYNE7|nr:pitrilysin family protein [Synechococcus elongatus]ABB57256.1 processing protease [Synechococcus elongatus PCC 7942 = FACHB-805]AJD58230.1 peptidase M16 [Synechococcus elongatus UTEX 2973]MBD2587662.1 insulinase family protein [Synechococcus elongatus FACHB-242]MBD2688559.1 insulinase family protein [Synechococcus elongatus FACHB-1061]MBD2707630.1 insulinase family protein [Synechococcus elongatus PCC 7942 = FACHB-805]